MNLEEEGMVRKKEGRKEREKDILCRDKVGR
jgi:hypothetical protein